MTRLLPRGCSFVDAQGPCAEYATNRGRCDQHQREQWRKRDGAFKYGARHRKDRRKQLTQQPICQWPGCHEQATELDHIIPLAAGGAEHDPANHQSLCTSHHELKTQQDKARYGTR